MEVRVEDDYWISLNVLSFGRMDIVDLTISENLIFQQRMILQSLTVFRNVDLYILLHVDLNGPYCPHNF